MGETIEKCAGQAFGSESLRPFVERQVAGDQCRAPLVGRLIESSRFLIVILALTSSEYPDMVISDCIAIKPGSLELYFCQTPDIAKDISVR